MQAQLNKRLYAALVDVYGDVGVHASGDPGTYTLPPTKNSMLKKNRSERKFAHVGDSWGETYSICCPVCNDHKKRLFISYMTGKTVASGSSKWQFGRVAVCHNERCYLKEEIDELIDLAETYTDIEVEEVSKVAARKFMTFVAAEVELPHAYPLYRVKCPKSVHDYLWERGFDPSILASQYEIRYLEPGTLLWTKEDGEEVRSYEDRILIPIIQGMFVTGWQARVVDPNYTGKYKYIFPPTKDTGGAGKSTWVYNMDKSKFTMDITICEGVTDVWKYGKGAVCTFGKYLSERQIYVMKKLWGFKGSCVICADHDAIATWEKNAQRLRDAQVFPKGVVVIPFPEGYDAADYETQALHEMVEAWRPHAHN